jgi:hypothetical protein
MALGALIRPFTLSTTYSAALAILTTATTALAADATSDQICQLQIFQPLINPILGLMAVDGKLFEALMETIPSASFALVNFVFKVNEHKMVVNAKTDETKFSFSFDNVFNL